MAVLLNSVATRKVPHEVHALKVQLDQILAKSKKAEKELASIVVCLPCLL